MMFRLDLVLFFVALVDRCYTGVSLSEKKDPEQATPDVVVVSHANDSVSNLRHTRSKNEHDTDTTISEDGEDSPKIEPISEKESIMSQSQNVASFSSFTTSSATESWMIEMLNFVNYERRRVGLSELCLNSKLNSAATTHSNDMARKNFFSHTGSDGSNAGTRVTRTGYKWTTYAENIYYYGGRGASASVSRVHNEWMESPGHRVNILKTDVKHMGVARVMSSSTGRQYWTQVFGSSNSDSCSSTNSGSGTSEYSRKFVLVNPATRKVIAVKGASCTDGANVHLWTRDNKKAQIFHYHYATNAIINVHCNKAIDVRHGNCGNGANIQSHTRNGTGAQKFSFDSDGTIRNILCNKVIDIYQKYTDDGTNLWLYSKNGDWDTQWKYEYV
mmetsp:Transcript_32334/g.39738  ORF Transcript_32334/g.39738 Transcript_32334/m.39738 type:complete len:387 (+) Transcript_32334:125-1285(+)|eukprot:CAMPEP_0172503028 /NCGR_PEP_ID=MMETSP1066-20121228/165206_1 /TAXON_ID=671091 /ORGANISM="Coscinodiscus wailesii, Strain CCMP2513" /LENGTH=386 /DNA_ID=CAMNT_0013278563 /DNA_START=105 /DNA_END=1265 /DNA_ORIENTATION=+